MKTLISIIGPTGIGKTKLAIAIARFFDTEILSCDSRQFFQEMKIGTASPSEEELAAAKHHFVGHLSALRDDYSIGKYEEDALGLIDNLFIDKDKIVLVGGSGMYEKAVTEGLNSLPKANEENQKKMEKILETEGIEALQNLLEELDKDYFESVDKNNPRRLLRAIDIIFQTGEPYSKIINKPKQKRPFRTIRIGLEAPREIIYQRINQRVDMMMENGLKEEAIALYPYRDKVALQTVGYTELFKYLDGEWTLDFAVEEIKKNSRRYAKRQMTWNRSLPNVYWLPYDYSERDLVSLLESLT
ncbi:tRNA dimethylallyltransferase [Riemerella columbipharyngis]|uniref:tRNA dimethylallyltransferase n=1 Tax=Riemerella columbipharyngis TaxID=1071918 RepID=A0A1G7E8L9_9FLAO|nr:tRNA dimethylallyltransferase [Riemerella columbipharyngis]